MQATCSCDVCQRPVEGIRWKCVHSEPSYDLCSECHTTAISVSAGGGDRAGTGRRAFLRISSPLPQVAAQLWAPSPAYQYAHTDVDATTSGASAAATVPAPGQLCSACAEPVFTGGLPAYTHAWCADGPWLCAACVDRGAGGAAVLLELPAPVSTVDPVSPDVVCGAGAAPADPLAVPTLGLLLQKDVAGVPAADVCAALFPPTGALPVDAHHGVACDVCGVGPVVGPRFMRVDVPNYDLCWACFTSAADPKPGAYVLLPR
jgi:hypothetical protein